MSLQSACYDGGKFEFQVMSHTWGIVKPRKWYKCDIIFSKIDKEETFLRLDFYTGEDGGEWYLHNGVLQSKFEWFMKKISKNTIGRFIGKVLVCKNGNLKFNGKVYKTKIKSMNNYGN